MKSAPSQKVPLEFPTFNQLPNTDRACANQGLFNAQDGMAINVSTLDSALASKDRSAISGSHQSNHGGRLQYSVSFSKGSEGSSIYL